MIAPDRVKQVTDNFEQQAASHFTYLWSHSSESEKITMLMVLALSGQDPSKGNFATAENLADRRARSPQDAASLLRRGLLDEDDGAYRIFALPFGRWIRREIMAAPGQEESQETAEEWLVAGGHKELKEAKVAFARFKKDYWPLLGLFLKDLSIKSAATFSVELAKALAV